MRCSIIACAKRVSEISEVIGRIDARAMRGRSS
jgi:hypothetical protein